MDIEKMKAYLDSPEGLAESKKYFEELAEKQAIQNSRFRRFDAWLEDHDFDILMYRLILEHGDDYREKCYHNGCEPYPNNKLGFVIDYVSRDDVPHPITVKGLECDFYNEIWEFRGYYFQHIHGQGVITRIYNKDDLRLLLQL